MSPICVPRVGDTDGSRSAWRPYPVLVPASCRRPWAVRALERTRRCISRSDQKRRGLAGSQPRARGPCPQTANRQDCCHGHQAVPPRAGRGSATRNRRPELAPICNFLHRLSQIRNACGSAAPRRHEPGAKRQIGTGRFGAVLPTTVSVLTRCLESRGALIVVQTC
jgi:hypothetical protein